MALSEMSKLLLPLRWQSRSFLRFYSAPPKRFYKKTGILYSDGIYEIALDQRKLKTPRGRVMKLDKEMLALAVAAEWDAQKDEINQSTMHITALCNTALENPNNITKVEAADKLLSYLETDAILYHSTAEDMYDLQKKEWVPIIDWFNERFQVNIEPTRDLGTPNIPEESKKVILRHLLSYNLDSLHGFLLAVESLKSLIIALCCVERKLNVDQGVVLTRLEEEFQAGNWGRVEWAHDVTQLDLQARVAAAILFIHLNSMSDKTRSLLATKFSQS